MPLEFVAFIVSILPTIEKYVVDPIRRQLGYLLCYNCNIEDFRKQVENLELERSAIQFQVDAAERKGEVILPNVEAWLTSVDKITEESRNLLNDDNGCFNGHCLCLDLKLSYQRSRKAKKKTAVANELKRDGKFDIVSCTAPPPAIGSTSTEDAEVFESRKLIVKEIMEALKDGEINMIGIYGMGGVGKTTLVKDVGKQSKDNNLFDEVVMAAVSQTPNLKNIQGEIADMLGLKFDEESESGRARRLSAKLQDLAVDKKRILVILDDIWERLELEAIGIPFGAKHKGCKVLLTSRSQDVCSKMGTQRNFSIAILFEQEAWNLFRKMVGDSVDSPDLHPLAVEVAKECAGLPIAIVTIARALKNKSPSDWRDAANQLRKSSIPDRKVYLTLELSYKHLGSEEVKSFFLLCCLFPEDSNIAIRDLLKYGMGLGLFQDVDTVDEAIERAHRLANDLKSSCLLQDSSKEDCVKMHDVVRDVAISIASKDKHVFLVRAGPRWKEWPKKDTFKHYTAISLMSNDIHELPDGLECPELQILLLGCSHPSLQFPNNFFLRMENLKVLDMSGMHFLSLPPLLRYLKNLRTLCLDYCNLEDISIIGELKKLEILSFCGSDIKELTKEIGMLTHLRLLDLTRCEELTIIPLDVIQGLSQLEGLWMEGSFDNWEIEREDKERSNASLAELKPLSRLTTLEIEISNANCLPKDSLFENLSRFKISIGTSFERWGNYSYSKVLKLKLNVSTPLKDGVNVLLKKAEHLHLEEMKGLKSVLNDLDSGGFLNLRNLDVRQCNEVEYIFNATEWVSHAAFPILKKLNLSILRNLKEICHGQLPTGLINMWKDLTVVNVRNCDRLKNLFSHSIAKDLSKLVELEVFNCEIMEEIFGNEKEAAAAMDEIVFPHLRSLKLEDLPNLINFCSSKMKCLALKGDLDTHTEGTLFDKKVAFPALETLVIRDVGNFKEMWHPQPPAKSFSQLRVLQVYSYHKVLNVVPFNLLQRLRNLEELHVSDCDSVEEVVEVEGLLVEEGHVTGMLSQLRILKLWNLPKLKHMWWDKYPRGTLGFQNLSYISIYQCNSLKSLFSPSIANSLVQLREVEINSCEMMETIIAKEREGEENCIEIIVFPQLRALQLQNLPILMSFYKEVPQEGNPDDPIQPLFDQKVTFPTLEELKIEGLDNLKDIWHPQVPAESFRQLRVLKVKSCHKILNVVPSNSLKGLKNLEKVSVMECDSVEAIFEIEELVVKDRHGIRNLSQLRKLKLSRLPKLLTSTHSFLQKLQKNDEEFEESPKEGNSCIPIQPLFDEWVTFPTLEELKIEGLDNLKDIWHPQVPAESFRQLRVLEVKSCHKILNVVPSNSLKGLKNLEEVSVMECDSVEIVFEIEELFVKDRHGIGNLSQLRKLELSGLPKLLASKHPFLQKLKMDDEELKEKPEEGNSCIPIRPLFDEWVVALTNLEELWISNFENLQEIFHNQLPDKFFCQLKTLGVERCNKLSRVFPSNLLPRLKNLEEFSVSECNSVEEIFEGPIGEGQAIISLSQLQTLWLRDLPSLRVFCSGNYTLECPSLTDVLLKDCPKMHTFSSGFISTPKLNRVTLKGLERLWKGDLNSTVQHLFHEKGKLKSNISSGQEVEEEEEGEKVHKKSEEADEVEEELESEENASAQAIQHEISELVEEEA